MNNGLRLIPPSEEYLEEYHALCTETWGHLHDDYILHDPALFHQWRNTIFEGYARSASGIGLPAGYAPSSTFWALDGARMVAVINIRHSLTPVLEEYGGHVGITVRLPLRRQGYSRRLFPLALSQARSMGISPVLFTCTADNPASIAVLSAFSPLRTERAVTTVLGPPREILRFWY